VSTNPKSNTPNLYQKISEITEAVGIIQKDAKAPKEMGGYDFTSHGSVIGHLRHELTSRNVVIRPSGEELLKFQIIEKKKVGSNNQEYITYTFHSIIKYKFTVVDGDNLSDFFEDNWIGEGMDTADKGIQKAGTSAEKYYLMKLFKIGDRDDPDGISIDGADGSSSVKSESATIGKQEVRAAGTPGAFSRRAVEETKQQELVNVPAEGTPTSNGSESPETVKNKIEALVWFGEQLPATSGWFRGKTVALVTLWDNKSKKGSLTPEEKEAGSAVNYIFGQIADAHLKHCGKECEHMQAAQLAVILGGKITDPAK